MLRLDLRDYSDTYTFVKEIIKVKNNNNDSRWKKRSCTAKINNTFIDNAKHLDIVIPMYNLFRHSGNYSVISGSMWHY